MKKILLLFILFLGIFSFASQVHADTDVTTIYVHYYRFDGDYTNWNLWAWQNEPTSEEGSSYAFSTDNTSGTYNWGGVVAAINVADNFPNITRMGLIVRLGEWVAKDIDSDRFVDIPAQTVDGQVHFYLVQGEQAIGTSIDDPDGPSKLPKFNYAYFTELDTIKYNATESLPQANIRVYADDIEITPASITTDGASGTILLSNDLDFTKEYKIEATFPSNSSVNDYKITYDGIYDSQAFNDQFAYEDSDSGIVGDPGRLGATVVVDNDNHANDKTYFRVWAPISDAVTLNLYDTGTPAIDGGTDVPIQQIPMLSGVKGTFYYVADSNLHGTYYTYTVTNGNMVNEVVDPYAQGLGVNGVRGLVVDFDQVNTAIGFTPGDRPDNITNATDAIIYEMQIREFTTSPNWNGTEANRGKYLGVVESGTSYDGIPTGFDHLVDLGITNVQIQPFFDFGVVDETRLDDPTYNSYNWGYMPLNFNAPEGSFSSDPYDGLVRIQELKQMIEAFSAANIRVNMDVVYNHTGLTANSNFNLIVPGYYYRKTADGTFSNGSGTGNEMASERVMMRKFIVDSTIFWADEYDISGFRFDLMSLEDITTMNEVTTALHSMDPTIMVYGEPWTGGTTTLPSSQMASKLNLYQMPTVGAFNDNTRDGIKGSVFQAEAGGFIQGGLGYNTFKTSVIDNVKYGIVGGIDWPDSSVSAWHTQPIKTINYVACHDNNTLHDKLYLTLEGSDDLDLIPDLAKQAYGIVLTSQGVPFIYAGDEFLRSKPLVSGSGFDHNSYQSPDSVNMMRWDLLATPDGQAVNNYIKGLIEIRKSHPSFRMPSATDVTNNLNFVYTDTQGVIAYQIANGDTNDIYDSILVIQNANDDIVNLTLPQVTGGWALIVDKDTAGTTNLDTYLSEANLSVAAHATYILYHDPTIVDDTITTTAEATTTAPVTTAPPTTTTQAPTTTTEPMTTTQATSTTVPTTTTAESSGPNVAVIVSSIAGGIIVIAVGALLIIPRLKK